MRGRTDPATGVVVIPGRLGLDGRNESRHVVDRKDPRVDDQRVRASHQQRDGSQVGLEIVGKVAVDRAVDSVGSCIAEKQRVAVRGRSDRNFDAKPPASTRSVLHQELTSQHPFKMWRKQTQGGVVAATGCTRLDDTHGPCRPSLGKCAEAGEQRRRAKGHGGRQHSAAVQEWIHEVSPAPTARFRSVYRHR